MPITEEQIKEALKQVKYPGFSRDIVSFGLVKAVRIDAGEITVQRLIGRAAAQAAPGDTRRAS